MNRRAFLRTLLATSAVAPLAACGTVNWTNVQSSWNQFVDNVTALVAKGCSTVQGFIPTVITIADAVAALYGTGAEEFVAGIGGSVNAVATALCAAVVPTTTTVASGKLVVSHAPDMMMHRRLAAATEAAPVTINTISINHQSVVIRGYSAAKFLGRRHYGSAKSLYEQRAAQAHHAWDSASPGQQHSLEQQYSR